MHGLRVVSVGAVLVTLMLVSNIPLLAAEETELETNPRPSCNADRTN